MLRRQETYLGDRDPPCGLGWSGLKTSAMSVESSEMSDNLTLMIWGCFLLGRGVPI